MKRARTRVQINLPELDQVLEQARQAPLSDPDYQKLRDTLHLLVGLLQPTARSTEKTSAVLAEAGTPEPARSLFRMPACSPAPSARLARRAKSTARRSPSR
jgi:hypothetical protein